MQLMPFAQLVELHRQERRKQLAAQQRAAEEALERQEEYVATLRAFAKRQAEYAKAMKELAEMPDGFQRNPYSYPWRIV